MSAASIAVAAIDTAILSIVSKQVSSWSLDGVVYTAQDLDKLREMRDYYAQIYAGELSTASKVPRFGITQLGSGNGQ
jgi:hypothetical protein